MSLPPYNPKILEQIRQDPEKFYRQQELSETLRALHARVKPHSGQLEPGRAIFQQKKNFVFLQCGRSWGKTYFEIYCCVRFALLNPHAKIYIVLPERAQAQEVVWESGMLQAMIPREYLPDSLDLAYNKTDLRVRFKNGSYIRLMGSDNPDSLRGIKPHFVCFDEFRDFKSDVFDIMEPNLGANNAQLVIGSTPPDSEGAYTKLRDFFLKETKGKNPNYFYLELPTETNPHYPKARLEQTRAMMMKRGEMSTFLREYMARYIPGGAAAVFPTFGVNKSKIVKPLDLLAPHFVKDANKLEWFAMFDPGSTTTFAVMFAAINRYTGQIFILDEIYERDPMQMGSLQIWERANEIKRKLFPKLSRWNNIYDEAAAWFINDLKRHGVDDEQSIEATLKSHRDKAMDLSMWRELFSTPGKVFIAQRCEACIFEIENYTTDNKGKFSSHAKDHCIDLLRYLLAASDFEVALEPEPDRIYDEAEAKWRSKTIEEIFDDMKEANNPTFGEDDNAMYTEEDEVIDIEDMGNER